MWAPTARTSPRATARSAAPSTFREVTQAAPDTRARARSLRPPDTLRAAGRGGSTHPIHLRGQWSRWSAKHRGNSR
eukprot:9043199-Pyramimonas_sp.AAC.1